MSLVLWLPLNGNIENQGLTGYIPQSVGTLSFSNSGKTGKAYVRATTSASSTNGISIPNNMCEDLGTEYSISVWVKPAGTHTHYNGTVFSSGNWNETAEYAFGVSQDNSKVDAFGPRHNTYVNCPVPVGEWTHLVSTHKDKVGKVYKNGEYVGKYDFTGDTLSSTALNVTIGRETYANGYFGFNGEICDVRVYNHCLSEKEVHELSKALILHYKLDDEYLEKTVNLGGTSINYSNKVYGTEYAASSWGGDKGTVTFYPSGGYNNYPYKVFHKTSGGTGGIHSKTANDITIESGKTYTMSVYVKSDREFTDSTYSFNINGSSVTSNNHYITASASVHFTTDWQRLVRTFTATSAQTGKYGEMSIVYNDAVDDYYVYYSGFQIELNDHATPYVNGTNTPICHDDSGYRRDGTINGILKTYDDSSRFDKSTYFGTNTSTYVLVPEMYTAGFSNSYTFSWWAKTTVLNAKMVWGFINGNRLNIYPTSNRFCLNTGDSANNPFQNNGTNIDFTPYQNNEWHHYAVCGNGVETLLYIDGEYKGKAKTYKSITGTKMVLSGWDTSTSYKFTGNVVDFRLYATALSAEDVKELYNLGASIDRDGNIFTYEMDEVTTPTQPTITKRGQFGADNFENEEGAHIYKDKHVGGTYFYEI